MATEVFGRLGPSKLALAVMLRQLLTTDNINETSSLQLSMLRAAAIQAA